MVPTMQQNTVKKAVNYATRWHSVENLHIISEDKVIFAGNIDKYIHCDPDMIQYKKKVDSAPVARYLANGSNFYIFIE